MGYKNERVTTLPFDGVFEVGLTDCAVIEEYGGT